MNCSYHTMNHAVVHCSQCTRPLCPACDHRIRGFPFCQDCIVVGVELLRKQSSGGSAVITPAVRRQTSPSMALFLSLVVPGLGAAYNGQTSKALVHFTIFASFFQMVAVTGGLLFFTLGIFGTWLFAAVDSYRTAQLMRAGLTPDTESDAITRRLYGNPLAWATLLIALGTIFLLHTLFDVRLPVREFLPVALIGIGLYMLTDYVHRRRRQQHQQRSEQQMAYMHQHHQPPLSVVGQAGLLEETSFRSNEFATHVATRQRR